MAASLVIRAPELEDLPALTRLSNLPGVRHGTLRLPFTSEDAARQRFLGGDANSHPIVGSLEGRLVAHAALLRRSGRIAHVGEVFLTVDDDEWGKGIGRQMLVALLDLADNWLGLVRVQLGVNTDNLRAIRLYESLGFEREGLERAAILRDGRYIDSYAMARIRTPPSIGAAPS